VLFDNRFKIITKASITIVFIDALL